MTDPMTTHTDATRDDLGLSIDMLDVDRLREWARLLLIHGPNLAHWGSAVFVAGKMQMIATGIEKAIKDIGTLRAAADALATAETERQELREALRQLRIDANRLCDRNLGGTYEDDCRRSIAKADAALRPDAPAETTAAKAERVSSMLRRWNEEDREMPDAPAPTPTQVEV